MIFSRIIFILLLGTLASWGRVIKIKKCRPKNVVSLVDYGQKVNVDGKTMVFGVFGENNEIPIVLLPGLGVNAPVLSLKPFAEALSDKFKIIVVEPFGYGLSDSTDKERSLDNIVSELHTAVHEFGLNKFYLMGHSVGGLYALGYSHLYPEDLLGVIGIDNTPSGLEDVKIDMEQNQPMFTDCNNKFKEGYFKNITEEELIQYSNPIDLTYNYSTKDLNDYKIIFGNTCCNDNGIDENYHFNSNIDELEGIGFPDSLPVLQFVSSVNCNYNEKWKPSHEALVSNSTINEVVELEGSHFLYIEQRDEIAKRIKTWIN